MYFTITSSLYIFVYQICMIYKYILLITFLNKPKLICIQLNSSSATRQTVVPWYIKKGVRQMSGREY